ncbi:MAG: hypothetical protein CO077_01215 [Candidatus Nealsonbacteria bacterium CG_4_9_14_0_8_um_filter_35_12]|uniref:Gingipain domain-containing protein n=1 Tax=Candidatus Nealsonbacteria bacterium CG_4_9_14_0_8_um_filter_35_12 TaxID=1974692 RepID=A0A2M8DN86_9BACT|nr:MAG: hypothetical protein CO077_01215 [Candidatus Nealsonbacteria bacterium CG_4_9_14_0_8_um_filter_35_12]
MIIVEPILARNSDFFLRAPEAHAGKRLLENFYRAVHQFFFAKNLSSKFLSMKTSFCNKGQTLIGIIIVIILVGLVTGGLYFYFQKQISEVPEITKKPAEEEVIKPEEVTPEEEVVPTCQDECSQTGLKRCSNNGYQICGNYDEDKCLEWGSVVACPSNTVCKNGTCVQQKCVDGTLYGQCSINKPKYCEGGNLINKCSICGCLSGQQCQGNENCIIPVEKIVAVFVDTNTYNSLRSEVDQYLFDVNNDLNLNAQLFVENFTTPQQVRSELLRLKDKNLAGSVLIGNIPIPYFESSKPFVGGDNIIPSDWYYMLLERTDFVDEDNNGMFEWEKFQGKFAEKESQKLYWSGRIKLYNNDLNLLKSYFNRNHLYRINQIKTEKSLIVYSPNIQSGPSGATLEIYTQNIKDSFSRSGLYNKDQISVVVGISRDSFLSELSKEYESASINAHGDAFSQEIGEGVSSKDIARIKPKPYFYYLLSCSNADFSKENYLAGHYLFDGNGLVVFGNTDPAMVGADESHFYMEYLSQEETFGEAFVKKQSWVSLPIQEVITGDPTLRMRFFK